MHEAVELIKALAWPCVVFYFLIRFHSELKSLLREMPDAIRRMRSAHGLGVEIELDKIGSELQIAGEEARALSLQMPTEPKAFKPAEGG